MYITAPHKYIKNQNTNYKIGISKDSPFVSEYTEYHRLTKNLFNPSLEPKISRTINKTSAYVVFLHKHISFNFGILSYCEILLNWVMVILCNSSPRKAAEKCKIRLHVPDSLSELKFLRLKQKVNDKLITKMVMNAMSPQKQILVRAWFDRLSSKTKSKKSTSQVWTFVTNYQTHV